MYIGVMNCANLLRSLVLSNSIEMHCQLSVKDAEIVVLRGTYGYRPTMDF